MIYYGIYWYNIIYNNNTKMCIVVGGGVVTKLIMHINHFILMHTVYIACLCFPLCDSLFKVLLSNDIAKK